MARTSGARPRVAAASAVALLLTVGCSSPDPTSPSRPSAASSSAAVRTDPERTDPDRADLERAATEVLSAQLAALRDRDEPRFRRTLADPDSTFGRAQLHAYATFGALPVTGLRLGRVRLVADPAASSRADADRFTVTAPVSYTFAGFDTGSRTAETTATLSRAGRGWRLAESGGAMTPWEMARAAVASGPRVLVVAGDPTTASATADRADAAIDAVDAVWTAPWPHRLVVLAPSSEEEMQRLVLEPEDLGPEVAAVTDGLVATDGPAPADRIILRPQAMTELSTAGRVQVLTHEAMHVALRHDRPGYLPEWVSEGIAEVAGYRAVRPPLPAREIVRPLAEAVRRDGLPSTLPEDARFARGDIAPAYNAAWVAITVLLDRLGPERLTTFIRAARADSEAESAKALRRAFIGAGLTPAEFTARWRDRVAALTR